MPMYDFKCGDCGHVTPVVLKVDERNRTFICDICKGVLKRVEVSKFAVAGDYPGYESPASGRWIEGRRAHQNELRRTGCRLLEPGETQAFVKGKAERERQKDAVVDRVVEQAAASLGLGV